MNIKNKIMLFIGWLIAGVVLCYIILYMGVFIISNRIINGLIMAFIPLLLFLILNWHNKFLTDKKKAVSHYFAKSIICLFIGGMLSYIRLFIIDDPFAVFIAIIIFFALLILLINIKIVQLIYTSTKNNRVYFAYIILGVAIAVNISYIIKLIIFRGYEDGLYVITHIILLALSIILIRYDYKKMYIKQKDIIKISNKQYIKNAIKLTSVPFLLFIIPLTMIFVCLQ